MGRAKGNSAAVSLDLFDPVLGARRGREETEAERLAASLPQPAEEWRAWKASLPATSEQRQRLYEKFGATLPQDEPRTLRLGDTLENHPERFVEATHETGFDLVKIRAADDQRAFQFWLAPEESGLFLRHCQQMLTDEPPAKPSQMRLQMNTVTPTGATDATDKGRISFAAIDDGSSLQITLMAARKTAVFELEPYEIRALAGWMMQNTPVTDPEFPPPTA